MITVKTDWIPMHKFNKKEKCLFAEFNDLTKFIEGVEYEVPNEVNTVGRHDISGYNKVRVKYILSSKDRKEVMQILGKKIKNPRSLIEIIFDAESNEMVFASEFRKYISLLKEVEHRYKDLINKRV